MEEWRPLRETDAYEASDEGRIRNSTTGRILKGTISDRGRVRVILRINGKVCARYVHRLIAEAFYGDACDGYDVYHRDCDILNNRLDNLVIGTRAEAVRNTYRNGRRQASNMRAIRCVETGEVYSSIAECSRVTGLNQHSICRNVNGSTKCMRGGRRFEPIE